MKFLKAVAKLESFESPEEVRGYLVKKGYTGRRGFRKSCPLSKFWNNVKGCDDVSVGVHESVPVYKGCRQPFQHPTAVATFVRNFDTGKYPELECP